VSTDGVSGALGRVRDASLSCGRRCALIALVVGTILTAVNEGDLLVAGEVQGSFGWKIPLNYLVPFAVSTLGYLSARGAGRPSGGCGDA
jgi:hypothetical protein